MNFLDKVCCYNLGLWTLGESRAELSSNWPPSSWISLFCMAVAKYLKKAVLHMLIYYILLPAARGPFWGAPLPWAAAGNI